MWPNNAWDQGYSSYVRSLDRIEVAHWAWVNLDGRRYGSAHIAGSQDVIPDLEMEWALWVGAGFHASSIFAHRQNSAFSMYAGRLMWNAGSPILHPLGSGR